MKLRNKKTGEIREFGYLQSDYVKNLVLTVDIGKDSVEMFPYDSLAELNEEWEDYKPAEPLIKDEKIRKAVRAWSKAVVTRESDGIKKVFYDADEWSLKFSGTGWATIQFNQPLGLGLEDGEYTIDEFCGEEEE